MTRIIRVVCQILNEEKKKEKKRNNFVRSLRQLGLKIEFANLSYLKKDQTTSATSNQFVQEHFFLLLLPVFHFRLKKTISS